MRAGFYFFFEDLFAIFNSHNLPYLQRSKMSVAIKWFPPSWIQINTQDKLIYIDPAYLNTNFKNYPKRIEFSSWPDPIDGLPEDMERLII
jgi:hypothetical protein